MQDVHLGSLPPEFHGGSVYLYRLSKIDKKAIFLNYTKFRGDNRKFWIWCLRQIFNVQRKNFIFHPPDLKPKIILFFLSSISVHSFSIVVHGPAALIQYNNDFSLITKAILRIALNRAKFIQVVNPTYKKFLELIKVKNKNIFIKNAFLLPPLEDEERVIKTYKRELKEFLEKKNPKIVANASAILLYKGMDLYGLDMIIELIKLLKTDFPNIGLIFALNNDKIETNYLNKMIKRIEEYNLKSNFYFMIGKNMWPLFKRVDLMVRPTSRDGYGSSIAEALFLKCPAIASDVCKRPKGTILFKSRDLSDFYNKCKAYLMKKKKNLVSESN